MPTRNPLSFTGNAVLGTTNGPVVLELFKNGVNVHPNPFDSELEIDFNVSEAQEVTLQLFNATNQLVLSKKVSVAEGLNSYKLTTQFSTGIYFLHIGMQDETIIEKLINK
jgi:hypothetical protein